MIACEELSKRYRDVVAVDGITFHLDRGEVVGFLGPNGAGKTTTLRMLTGALPPTGGRARVAGFDVLDEPEEVKSRVGYLPEVPPVYPDLTVEEYLRFVGTLKGLRRAALCHEIDRVAAAAGLDEVRPRLIRNLSKGFRQRTGIAQALLGDPQVLILDEPTAGLDPRQIEEMRQLIREAAGSRTILLSTHILQEVVAVCDRVIVINRGRIVADDRLDLLSERHNGAPLEQVFLSLTEV